jgi:putative endonuclease
LSGTRVQLPPPPPSFEFALSFILKFLKNTPVFYAYILESLTTPREFYRGHDSDLKHRPWRIKFYAAFETLTLAQKFERYLKSGSGHEFAEHHLRM